MNDMYQHIGEGKSLLTRAYAELCVAGKSR